MKVFNTIAALQNELALLKRTSFNVGFVPTMGALHEGHLSLLKSSKEKDHCTVVSIFVNPTQFNDKNDFEKYPRNVDKDLEILESAGCNIVFVPNEKEIYPEPDTRVFDFGGLDQVMEGQCRPGHFNGVAQVVTRLFKIVKPCRAYFGYKDFQQLAIIRFIVKKYNIPVEIVACPIVRESTGLAMSSRNTRLCESDRAKASKISKVLFYLKDRYNSFHSVKEMQAYVAGELTLNDGFDLEYFEVVDEETLLPPDSLQQPVSKVGCIAVWIGGVRLIDNVNFLS
ncbi:MAG: pantoate--beta-alanine ligase [Bacteroidales bacterium]|nr:pantoate--beta-alanine ligase [Bacteroidales bacterium]